MTLPVTIDARYHSGVIFDLDGVVTDTASVHAAAWKRLFDAYFAKRPARDHEDHTPFTDGDYRQFVDGKPRLDGVTDFLASRGITLPWGLPSDNSEETVCGLGNRKQKYFLDLLAGGVLVFDSTVALVRKLRSLGIGTAVFTASRNCDAILTAAGLGGLFPIRVDGVTADELGLPGKPDPAVLIETARRLGVSPNRCILFEDAEAGVAAGRAGGFDRVVGVDRVGHAAELLRSGADAVVADLVEIQVRAGGSAMSQLPDALQVAQLIGVSRTPAVFLDFDGTLSEVVNDPAAATLVAGAAEALHGLAAQCPVAVLSGRDLADIRTRVGLPNIWYAGSHGFELVGPDGTHHQNDAAAAAIPLLERAADELRTAFRVIVGLLVEHKRFAVAVHYRNVDPRFVNHIAATVHGVGRENGLRVTNGRKVIELRPDIDWDKGRTLSWILDRIDSSGGLLPMYIGDDLTDEDAFDAVRPDGIGIIVRHSEDGDRRTDARFALDAPARVCELLTRLTEQLRAAEVPSDPWIVTFDGYDPSGELLREALCTVGNGYLATRGCSPDARAGATHYPGTYAAGVYNRLSDEVAGTTIDNESQVNLPNWLALTFRIDGGPWFDIDDTDLLSYRQTLDLRHALLAREFQFRDKAGRTTSVRQQRFVAMHSAHLCALQMTVVAESWSGTIEFRSIIDGDVRNSLVERYRDLSGTHVKVSQTRELSDDAVLMQVQTVQSQICIVVAVRNSVCRDGTSLPGTYQLVRDDTCIGHDISVDLAPGESVTLEKVAAVVTSRDPAISAPAYHSEQLLNHVEYEDLRRDHILAWTQLWERFSIDVEDDIDGLRVLRLHIVHLLQTVSAHTAELDAGVPARGLHGEAYRGHVFWDELFVFPVLNLHLPNITRSLLRYRYRRLPAARRAAHDAGYAGAMYPWQSGSDGREESQRLHLNPRSGRWNPDASVRAHHVGIAVAYNVWQYYQVTGDIGYLTDYGAEMLVEIARFWVSLTSYDDDRDRYSIRGVIGPDEFHSGYPNRSYQGIDNNAYTNVMAVWVIVRAIGALESLPLSDRLRLLERLALRGSEIAHWDTVSRRMFVPFHDGVISQFEGYGELAQLDWDGYRRRYGNIQRLDRILEAEGDDANRYQVSKQADALMLLFLLSADELRDLFNRLGYTFTPEQIPKTVDYYVARTSHGSTLSAVVHSWVLARGNRQRARDFFEQVLKSDVADIQGGTTFEGIHLAAMAGSIDLLQRCFTGLETRADRLVLGPLWPEPMGELAFPMQYRGHRLHLRVSGSGAIVTAEPGDLAPIDVECRGRIQQLGAGCTIAFP